MPKCLHLLPMAFATLLAASPALAQTAPMSAELQPGVTAKVVSLTHVPGQEIVQLDYEITNGGAAPVNPADLGLGGGAYGINEITLLDFPNELSFRVGVADQCLCSPDPEKPIGPGETLKAWAWFAPPATSAGPFAVRFGSTYPVMDVPLK